MCVNSFLISRGKNPFLVHLGIWLETFPQQFASVQPGLGVEIQPLRGVSPVPVRGEMAGGAAMVLPSLAPTAVGAR